MKTEFNYADSDSNRWILAIGKNLKCFTVFCDGESRTYDIDEKIIDATQKDEYVSLVLKNGYKVEVKFEVEKFLVGDMYDNYGEYVDSICCHTFGEND